VNSASGVWRLHAGLGSLGLLATTASLVVAVTRVDLALPSLEELAAACRRVALPDVRPLSVFVLALGSVGVAALVLTARAAVRQLRAGRRFERELRVERALAGVGRTYVIDDPQPHAFCSGLLRPRVYLSSAALGLLTDEERDAVLAHEAHHARRRDPLRLLVARALGEGLFFLPVLRRLAGRYAALAELAADEAAVRAGRGPQALASALLTFDAHPSQAVVGIAPERVDHLLGHRARWELPLLLVCGGVVTIAALLAVTLRVAEATAYGSVALPALLAQACMLAMAVGPVLFGAAVLLGGRRLVRRRRR
jgi:Zn-dependent protease with chaperone function